MMLNINGKAYDLNKQILHMAILNVTPDSFSDGGDYSDTNDLDKFIEDCENFKVDIIDIGGESSRPGAKAIEEAEELKRVIPAIKYIRSKTNIAISIDTYKSNVAEQAIQAGANMINDITAGLRDEKIMDVAAKYDLPYIIMHMQGKPEDMQIKPEYSNILSDINIFFEDRISIARRKKINQIIIDPGIGFGKTFLDNFKLIKNLNAFMNQKTVILIGASRKRFLENHYSKEAKDRDIETVAIHSLAIHQGARIIRTHNIEYGRKMIEICNQYINA